MSRFRDALARTLAEQLRTVLKDCDALAWDVKSRSEVFADTGLSTGPAMIAAVWSEIGNIIRRSDRFGWHATGTGIVKRADVDDGSEGQRASFAMGAEPQILSGEKRGPLGTGSEPLALKAQRIGERVKEQGQGLANQMDVEGVAAMAATDVSQMKQQAKDMLAHGKHTIQSFSRAAELKAEEEKKTPGWQTKAFDVRA